MNQLISEQVVLGAILQSAESFWQVSDVLRPEHFVRPVHQAMFAAIRDLLNEGKKASLTLIEARIGSEFEDGKSTAAYLSALVRDAEEQSAALDSVDDIVDAWRQRKLIELGEHIAREAKKDEGRSPELVTSIQQRLEVITSSSQPEPIKWIGEIAGRVMSRSRRAMDSGLMPGFDTGLPSLDAIMGRIHPGDLGAIGAAPGDGKTLVAAQIAMHAQNYGPVAFFQLEMKDEDMAARALAARANASVAEIESGSYDAFAYEDLVKARDALANARVIIDDRPRLAIEQIWERCATIKRRHGLIAVFIDHLRHVRTRRKAADKWERFEIVTGTSKAMAKELGVATIILSQVTRASQRREDDPAPRRDNLDGGGALDQDADWIIGLFRRDRWLKTRMPTDRESKEYAAWAREIAACRGRIQIQSLKGRRIEDGEKRDFEFDGRAATIREIMG